MIVNSKGSFTLYAARNKLGPGSISSVFLYALEITKFFPG